MPGVQPRAIALALTIGLAAALPAGARAPRHEPVRSKPVVRAHVAKAAPRPAATPAASASAEASPSIAATASVEGVLLEGDDVTSRIDWTHRTLYVTGVGLAPDRGSISVRRVQARRLAYEDGYRRLASALDTLRVSGDAYLEDLTIADDALRNQVDDLVRGARVTDTKNWPDGSVEVHLEVPLSRVGALADVGTAPASGSAPALAALGDRTGVVIDGRGLGAQPALALAVRDARGTDLFPPATGSAAVYYFHTVEAATEAAGGNPWVFKARRAVGATHADLLLTQEDADQLAGLEARGPLRAIAVVL